MWRGIVFVGGRRGRCRGGGIVRLGIVRRYIRNGIHLIHTTPDGICSQTSLRARSELMLRYRFVCSLLTRTRSFPAKYAVVYFPSFIPDTWMAPQDVLWVYLFLDSEQALIVGSPKCILEIRLIGMRLCSCQLQSKQEASRTYLIDIAP